VLWPRHAPIPLGPCHWTLRSTGSGRVRNDQLDAQDRTDLLRAGAAPEAWVVPPELPELRATSPGTAASCGPACQDQVRSVPTKLYGGLARLPLISPRCRVRKNEDREETREPSCSEREIWDYDGGW
jgi:hypothetical protein